MQTVIPQIEEDQIVLYAAVEGKDIEGFCEDGSFKAYISQSGKPSIKSYTNRTLSAGINYYLNNLTKEYFFKVRLIRKSFSTEIISYVCTAKQKLTN
jgi:hypothetical protein